MTFATPLIWHPHQDDQSLEYQVDQMLLRAIATEEWLQGRLETDSFCDLLAEQGIDVTDWVNCLDSGLKLI